MNERNDAIDVSDTLLSSISYMRTLLGEAEDKVQFYLSHGPQLGPYRELLARHAAETDALLGLMERFLDQMEQDTRALSDFACKAGVPA